MSLQEGLLEWYLEEHVRNYSWKGVEKEPRAQDGFPVFYQKASTYIGRSFTREQRKRFGSSRGIRSYRYRFDRNKFRNQRFGRNNRCKADWDDRRFCYEVQEGSNLAEIELDETTEIDTEDQNNKEIKN